MTEQLAESPVAHAARPLGSRRVVGLAAAALALSFGVFLLYFLAYPVRHLSLPVGFDPAYYVWRAQYLASQGIGTGSAASRPGYPILSAIAGSLTGLSQLQIMPVLSLVLVSLLALAVGAFASAGLGAGRARWALVVAVTGVVVGPTHLVGENLSNTLNLVLIVAALVPLAWAVGGGGGFWGAVAMLVAAGVAHWDFLVTFGMVLIVTGALALLSARRSGPEPGPSLARTEAGVVARVAATVAAIMAVLIGVVLRAPLVTIEVGQDRVLYWNKFKRDLLRLMAPAVAGTIGGWAFVPGRRTLRMDAVPESGLGASKEDSRRRQRAFSGRLLAAWTGVMVAGIVLGAVTLKLPPARFLALLVAVPGAIVTAWVVAFLASRVRTARLRAPDARAGVVAAWGVVVVAVAALALPGVFRWYRYPVLLKEQTLEQARLAGQYLQTLPPHDPVIFVVDYFLAPFPTGPILAEREIKIGLPPQREADAHVFVGDVSDLLQGRLTPPPNARLELATRPYRKDVVPLIGKDPVTLVLQGVAGRSFQDARRLGATAVGPGVLVLRAPAPPSALIAASQLRAETSLVRGSLWGLGLLVLLGACGAGWTRAILDPKASVETFVSMAPVVGAAFLILAGLVADEFGARLAGAGGVFVYLVTTMAGLAAARYGRRSAHGAEPSPPGEMALPRNEP